MSQSGYDISAGLSTSSSAAASLSGATEQRGGGNFLGTSYGAGSVINAPPASPVMQGVQSIGIILAAVAAAALVVSGLVWLAKKYL